MNDNRDSLDSIEAVIKIGRITGIILVKCFRGSKTMIVIILHSRTPFVPNEAELTSQPFRGISIACKMSAKLFHSNPNILRTDIGRAERSTHSLYIIIDLQFSCNKLNLNVAGHSKNREMK